MDVGCSREHPWPALLVLVFLVADRGSAQQTPPAPAPGLAGTSWRLVEFRNSDDTALVPDDPSKYTIAFEVDGRVTARIDCNRGVGSWRSAAPNQLEPGPLALTRAECPPGSLYDDVVERWPFVRSYVVRDGRLFLSLMADGGIFELEPAPDAGTPPRP
jgi:para-nitrobenzyl esterase